MRTGHIDKSLPELPTPYNALPPAHVKCFTEYLRGVGCYCSNNEKTDYQFPALVTAWDDCSSNGHWRNRPETDQPFFAVFNPSNTHESGTWPENCKKLLIDPNAVVVPPIYPDTPKIRESLAGIEIPKHIEGQAFLGEFETPEREFTYHSRDRYDTSYDQVRGVRTKRDKYIRNSYPHLSESYWKLYSDYVGLHKGQYKIEEKCDIDPLSNLSVLA